MSERTRMIVFVAFAALILMSWPAVMRYFGYDTDKRIEQAATQPSTAPTGGPTTQSVGPVAATLPTPVPQAAQSQIVAGLQPVPATQPAGVVHIGSAEWGSDAFAMQLSVNPVGGGLDQVLLNDFKDNLQSNQQFTFEKPYPDAQGSKPLSVRSIKVNGQTIDLSTATWQVVSQSPGETRLALDVADTAGTRVTLLKTFEVLPREREKTGGSQGFDTKVTYGFVNRGNTPVNVSASIVGPTFPPTERMLGGDRQLIGGYTGKNAVVLRHDALESFTAEAPTKDYTTYEDRTLLWVGSGSNYFNAIVRPDGASWIKNASAKLINPEAAATKREVLITLDTSEINLAPGQQQNLAANVFFGPRQRSLLQNEYYARAGWQYYHTLEISGSCAFCTWNWLVNLLMSLLTFFHWIVRDWGIAIILLVLVVRGLLHPITKKSQINMAKMAKMGPEIERLKKKHGDDKEGLNKAMMQFYRQNGATPILGCLPMFLQMPIWIALYGGLSTTFELRQQPFLYGLTWIQDLAKPDHLIEFAPGNQINFLFLHIDGINVIPLLLSIAFFVQFKLQPKPATMTPEQEQQQTMMKWMTTLLFPLMLYTSPSGLTLYILTSTTLGIIESHIIRKHIKEREAYEAANPTVVDAEIIDRPGKKPGVAGGLMQRAMAKFQELQEKAEQLKQDAEKKGNQKKR